MTSSHDRRRKILLLEQPDQARNPDSQDISTLVKQNQQDLPTCRHPDSSRVYLISGHDQIVQTSGRPNPELPLAVTGGCQVWTNTHEEHWPGLLIKSPRVLAGPYASFSCYKANGKTNVGPPWESFTLDEETRGPHKPRPC